MCLNFDGFAAAHGDSVFHSTAVGLGRLMCFSCMMAWTTNAEYAIIYREQHVICGEFAYQND